MTRVKVNAGICGFQTIIRCAKDGKYGVTTELISDCEHVQDLGLRLETGDALQLGEVIAKGEAKNRVFQAASEALPHSACPVRVAIIKAAEVELGLALPRPVTIEFEPETDT